MQDRKSVPGLAGILLAAPLLAAMVGCTKMTPGPITASENAPSWIYSSPGAKVGKDGNRVFYGVGIMSNVHNIALAVDQCDEQGRGKIAAILNDYVAKLSKSYMASTNAGDPKAVSEEQHVSSTLKAFAQATLHGSVPADTGDPKMPNVWKDPKDGTFYCWMQLSLADMKGMLDDYHELDAKIRDHVRANADKAFDELKGEESAHSN